MDFDLTDIGCIAAIFFGLGTAGGCQLRVSSHDYRALQNEKLTSLYSSALEIDLRSCSSKVIDNLHSDGGRLVGIHGNIAISPDHTALQFFTQESGSGGSSWVKAAACSILNIEEKPNELVKFIAEELNIVPCKLTANNKNVSCASVVVDHNDFKRALESTVSNIVVALGQSPEFLSNDPIRNTSVDTELFACSIAEERTRSWTEWWECRVPRRVRLFVPLGAHCTIVGRLVVDGGGLRITAHPEAGFGLFRIFPSFEVTDPLLYTVSSSCYLTLVTMCSETA